MLGKITEAVKLTENCEVSRLWKLAWIFVSYEEVNLFSCVKIISSFCVARLLLSGTFSLRVGEGRIRVGVKSLLWKLSFINRGYKEK